MFLQNLDWDVKVSNYKRFCTVKENKCLREVLLTSNEKMHTGFQLLLVKRKIIKLFFSSIFN